MVMVQGVGTATGPTFVVVTITLPRNSPVALSVPADVTNICAWQKLAFAFTVGGSCDGSSAFGFALRIPHSFTACDGANDAARPTEAAAR